MQHYVEDDCHTYSGTPLSRPPVKLCKSGLKRWGGSWWCIRYMEIRRKRFQKRWGGSWWCVCYMEIRRQRFQKRWGGSWWCVRYMEIQRKRFQRKWWWWRCGASCPQMSGWRIRDKEKVDLRDGWSLFGKSGLLSWLPYCTCMLQVIP